MGGLGFSNPSEDAEFEYTNSCLATEQLTKAIYTQQEHLEIDEEAQAGVMQQISERKLERYRLLQEDVKEVVSDKQFKLLELASEKGASCWLTSLPLKEFGFRLNKQEFTDALCLRYDMRLKDVPRRCECGNEYNISHCLTCKKGGFIHMRHDAVRNSVHDLVKGVCKDVKIEPPLLPLTGETLPEGSNIKDNARSDVSALGFWNPLSRAFFDIRVFNPQAQTNWKKEIPAMYLSQESEKKREYNARILEIEKGTFTPLVFSCTGGASPEASNFIKALALKISNKTLEDYSHVVSFIRRRICFDILKSCVVSLRGERRKRFETPAIQGLDFGIQRLDG